MKKMMKKMKRQASKKMSLCEWRKSNFYIACRNSNIAVLSRKFTIIFHTSSNSYDGHGRVTPCLLDRSNFVDSIIITCLQTNIYIAAFSSLAI